METNFSTGILSSIIASALTALFAFLINRRKQQSDNKISEDNAKADVDAKVRQNLLNEINAILQPCQEKLADLYKQIKVYEDERSQLATDSEKIQSKLNMALYQTFLLRQYIAEKVD